jgi:hypothetical protein
MREASIGPAPGSGPRSGRYPRQIAYLGATYALIVGSSHEFAGSREAGSASSASTCSMAFTCSGVAAVWPRLNSPTDLGFAHLTSASASPRRTRTTPHGECALNRLRSRSNSPVASNSDRNRSAPSGVSRCSRKPLVDSFAPAATAPSRSQIIRPSVYSQTRLRPSPRVELLPMNSTRSSPPSGPLGVAPTGGRPMKPRSRKKSRTAPIAEAAPTATTSAAAASATTRRRLRPSYAPARLITSAQSGEPRLEGRIRSRLARSKSVMSGLPPVGCEVPCALR